MEGVADVVGSGRSGGINPPTGGVPVAAPGAVARGADVAVANAGPPEGGVAPAGGVAASAGGATNVISAQSATHSRRRIRRAGEEARVFK